MGNESKLLQTVKRKLDSLKSVLDAIERQYGKGAVMRMDAEVPANVPVVTSTEPVRVGTDTRK